MRMIKEHDVYATIWVREMTINLKEIINDMLVNYNIIMESGGKGRRKWYENRERASRIRNTSALMQGDYTSRKKTHFDANFSANQQGFGPPASPTIHPKNSGKVPKEKAWNTT